MAGRFEYRPPPPPSPSASGGSSSSSATSDEDSDEDDDRSVISSRPPSPTSGDDASRHVDAECSAATPPAAAAAAAAAVDVAAASTNRPPSPIIVPSPVAPSPGRQRGHPASNASGQAPSAQTPEAEAMPVGATAVGKQTPSPSRKRGRQSTLTFAGTGAADSGQPSCPPPQISAPKSTAPHPAEAVAAVGPVAEPHAGEVSAAGPHAGPHAGPVAAIPETTSPARKQDHTRNPASAQESSGAENVGQLSCPTPQTPPPKSKEPTPAAAEAPVVPPQAHQSSSSLPPTPPPPTTARQEIPAASSTPRTPGGDKETPLAPGAAEPEVVGVGQPPRPTPRISTLAAAATAVEAPAAVAAVAAPAAASASPQPLSATLTRETSAPKRKRGRPPSKPPTQIAAAVAPPQRQPLATSTRGLSRKARSARGATSRSGESRSSSPTTRLAVAAAAAAVAAAVTAAAASEGAFPRQASSPTRHSSRLRNEKPANLGLPACSRTPQPSTSKSKAPPPAAAAVAVAAAGPQREGPDRSIQDRSSPVRKRVRPKKSSTPSSPPAPPAPRGDAAPLQGSITGSNEGETIGSRIRKQARMVRQQQEQQQQEQQQQEQVTSPAPAHDGGADNGGDGDMGGDFGDGGGDFGDDFCGGGGGDDDNGDICSEMEEQNEGIIASPTDEAPDRVSAGQTVALARTRNPAGQSSTQTAHPTGQRNASTLNDGNGTDGGGGGGGGGGAGSGCSIGQGASSASTKKAKPPGGAAVVPGERRQQEIAACSTAQQTRASQKTSNQAAPPSTNERNAEDGGTTAASESVGGEADGPSSTRDEDLALVWELHQENEGLLAVRKRVRKEVVTLQDQEDELRRALGLPPARSELVRPLPQPLPPLTEPVAAAPPVRKKARTAKQKRAKQRPRVSTPPPPPSPTPVGTTPSLPSAPLAPSPSSLPCVSLEQHPAGESLSNRGVVACSSSGSAAAVGGLVDEDVLLGLPPLSLPVPSSPAGSFDLASGENDDIEKLLLECDETLAAGYGNDSDGDITTTAAAAGGGGGGGVKDPGIAHREAQKKFASGGAPSSVWRGSPSRGHPDGKAPPSQGTRTTVNRKTPPSDGRGIGGVGLAKRSARPGVSGVGGGRAQQPNSGRGDIIAALRGGRGGRGASGGRGGVKKKTNYFDPNAPIKRRASGRGGASCRGIFGSRGGHTGGRAVVGVPTGSRGALGVSRLGSGSTTGGQRQPVEKAAAGTDRPAGTFSSTAANFPDGNKRPPGL